MYDENDIHPGDYKIFIRNVFVRLVDLSSGRNVGICQWMAVDGDSFRTDVSGGDRIGGEKSGIASKDIVNTNNGSDTA
ncbi:MAG: hypothetical protein IJN41_00985 [Firmicutes bacterium]|nr:hypothetical protein [Bacillota bacterium]